MPDYQLILWTYKELEPCTGSLSLDIDNTFLRKSKLWSYMFLITVLRFTKDKTLFVSMFTWTYRQSIEGYISWSTGMFQQKSWFSKMLRMY